MGSTRPPPTPGAESAPGGGAAPSDLAAGMRLGKYEIMKRLAAGGMAEIFLARVDALPGFQKIVVIKRILPQLATQNDFIEMFLDEARIAATLTHPNLVQVFDVGICDATYFMSMEYLHGEDVRSIMKTVSAAGKRLPVEHALHVAIGICAGLEYAHDKNGFDGKPLGIVHRDVSPQNVIVTFQGEVKLLDFGIAKASNRMGETRIGTLKGKIPYMSPEQCRSEALDRRTDVFSLGILLYELTLGRRLYRAKSEFEAMKRIVEGTVPRPTEVDPAYDSELERIVLRALEKDREARYQSAKELSADLEALVRTRRLYVSQSALKQYLEQLFPGKVEAWRDAQARGVTLGEHLQEQLQEEVELSDEDLRAEEEPGETRSLPGAATQSDRPRPTPPEVPIAAPVEAPALAAPALAATIDDEELPKLARGSGAAWVIGILALAGAGGGIWWWQSQREAPLAAIRLPESPRPKAGESGVGVVTPLAAGTGVVNGTGTGTGVVNGTGTGVVNGTGTGVVNGTGTGTGGEAAKVGEGPAGENGRPPVDGKHHHHAFQKLPAPPVAPAAPSPPVADKPAPAPAAPQAPPTAPVAPPASPPQAPPAATGIGTLVLATSPWCNVTIDGVDKGATPVRVMLPSGPHTVVLSNPDFHIQRTLPITLRAGETLRKKLDFAE